MAIIVSTSRPQNLMRLIRDAADDHDMNGWYLTDEGDAFSHNDADEGEVAFTVNIPRSGGRCIFNILCTSDTPLKRGMYAKLHAKLAEMLLDRFDTHFTAVRITAMPTENDRCGS